MKKSFGMFFYVSVVWALSLISIHSANSADKIEVIEEKASSATYSNENGDLLTLPDYYHQRRLFNWKDPQQFLDSFTKKEGVEVNFIAGELENKKGIYFTGNLKNKERILVIGAGLTYDDDVNPSKVFFTANERTGRIKFYPFNTYLADLGTYWYSEKEISSNPDQKASIKIPVGEKEGIYKDFIKEPFDVVVLEYIFFSLINQNNLTNISQILRPGGVLIFNCPVSLVSITKEDLKDHKDDNYIDIEGLGRVYYTPNELLPKSVSRFLLHCFPTNEIREMEESEINQVLQQYTPQVFMAFKEVINEWMKGFGFSTAVIETKTPLSWYSSCCNFGYCLAYKKK